MQESPRRWLRIFRAILIAAGLLAIVLLGTVGLIEVIRQDTIEAGDAMGLERKPLGE